MAPRIMRSFLLILLVPMLYIAPAPLAVADTNGQKPPAVEQVATLFRSACLATATSFSGFESALQAKGFSDYGNGYWVDGVHDMTFQIWKGEGRTFCTVFYGRPQFLATPNESHMNLARTFTQIGVPVRDWVPSRYDAAKRRYFTKIASDLSYEHKLMQDSDRGHLLRAVLVVPNE